MKPVWMSPSVWISLGHTMQSLLLRIPRMWCLLTHLETSRVSALTGMEPHPLGELRILCTRTPGIPTIRIRMTRGGVLCRVTLLHIPIDLWYSGGYLTTMLLTMKPRHRGEIGIMVRIVLILSQLRVLGFPG